jgi:hypothetical protein
VFAALVHHNISFEEETEKDRIGVYILGIQDFCYAALANFIPASLHFANTSDDGDFMAAMPSTAFLNLNECISDPVLQKPSLLPVILFFRLEFCC